MKIQKTKKCAILPFVTKFEVSFEVHCVIPIYRTLDLISNIPITRKVVSLLFVLL